MRSWVVGFLVIVVTVLGGIAIFILSGFKLTSRPWSPPSAPAKAQPATQRGAERSFRIQSWRDVDGVCCWAGEGVLEGWDERW